MESAWSLLFNTVCTAYALGYHVRDPGDDADERKLVLWRTIVFYDCLIGSTNGRPNATSCLLDPASSLLCDLIHLYRDTNRAFQAYGKDPALYEAQILPLDSRMAAVLGRNYDTDSLLLRNYRLLILTNQIKLHYPFLRKHRYSQYQLNALLCAFSYEFVDFVRFASERAPVPYVKLRESFAFVSCHSYQALAIAIASEPAHTGDRDQHVAADAELLVGLGAVAKNRRDDRKTHTHADLAKRLHHARHKAAHVRVGGADQHAERVREEKAAAGGPERLHGHNPPPVEVAAAAVPCSTQRRRGHHPREAQHERDVRRHNVVFHRQQRRHDEHADKVWSQLDCRQYRRVLLHVLVILRAQRDQCKQRAVVCKHGHQNTHRHQRRQQRLRHQRDRLLEMPAAFLDAHQNARVPEKEHHVEDSSHQQRDIRFRRVPHLAGLSEADHNECRGANQQQRAHCVQVGHFLAGRWYTLDEEKTKHSVHKHHAAAQIVDALIPQRRQVERATHYVPHAKREAEPGGQNREAGAKLFWWERAGDNGVAGRHKSRGSNSLQGSKQYRCPQTVHGTAEYRKESKQ
ncbi:hypothetical protein KL948_002680 [Ogataea haglerorum]|nr:hypothetical protein KL948_002680 [Ogataea haglerorum]KAG7758617.1 hypothetical protein KL947_002286 [Ogataea haglerorum]KAG7769511.1 hypothetical protein KL931_002757 [Ogataea haglerorum]